MRHQRGESREPNDLGAVEVEPRQRLLRALLVCAGLVVTVVFAYIAIRDTEWSEVWRALRESEKWWLLPAMLLLAAATVVRAVRWRALFATAGRPPLRAASSALLIGIFFNTVMPLRAGEAARVLALHQTSRVSRVEAAATVVLERAYDVIALLLLLFAIVPWLPDVSWLRPAAVLLVVLGVVLLGAAAVLARYGDRSLRLLLRPLSLIPLFSAARFDAAVLRFGEGLAGLRRPRVASEAFAWTVVSWILGGISTWLVLVSFDFGLSPIAGLVVMIAVNLALILPSSPAGLGVFEAATVVALEAYDVDRSAALSCALVLHALNSLPFIAVGLVLLHTKAATAWRQR